MGQFGNNNRTHCRNGGDWNHAATTRILTRILIVLEKKEMFLTEIMRAVDSTNINQIKDGLLWLVNHKLIKKYKLKDVCYYK